MTPKQQASCPLSHLICGPEAGAPSNSRRSGAISPSNFRGFLGSPWRDAAPPSRPPRRRRRAPARGPVRAAARPPRSGARRSRSPRGGGRARARRSAALPLRRSGPTVQPRRAPRVAPAVATQRGPSARPRPSRWRRSRRAANRPPRRRPGPAGPGVTRRTFAQPGNARQTGGIAEPRRDGRRRRAERDRRGDAGQALGRRARDQRDDAAGAQRRQRVGEQRPRIGRPVGRRRGRRARAQGEAIARVLGAERDRAQRDVGGGGQHGRLADGAALDDAAEQPARTLHVEHGVEEERRAAGGIRGDGEGQPPGREVSVEQLEGHAVGTVRERHSPRQVEERHLQLPVDDAGAARRLAVRGRRESSAGMSAR